MTTPDLSAYRAVHAALRLAPHRLATTAEAVDAGDRRRLKAFDAYWRGYAAEVLSHHSIEDDIMFPALVARVPSVATMIERTDEDHHRLDVLMASCTEGAARLVASPIADRRPLVEDLHALARHMDEHLDFEDAELLPLIEGVFTREEFDELEGLAAKATGLGPQAAFAVPFVLAEMAEADRAHLITGAPAPLRVLYALSKGRHARLSARVFGARAPEPVRA